MPGWVPGASSKNCGGPQYSLTKGLADGFTARVLIPQWQPYAAVELEFSEATARLLGPPADPKCQLWVTNEYQHNGLRADPNRIFERLLAMAKGDVQLPS